MQEVIQMEVYGVLRRWMLRTFKETTGLNPYFGATLDTSFCNWYVFLQFYYLTFVLDPHISAISELISFDRTMLHQPIEKDKS